MSISNYFKKVEAPSECLEKIGKNDEACSSIQLTSTDVECVVTELKSVETLVFDLLLDIYF